MATLFFLSSALVLSGCSTSTKVVNASISSEPVEEAPIVVTVQTIKIGDLSNLNKLSIVAPTNGTITTANFKTEKMIVQTAPAFIISNLDTLKVSLLFLTVLIRLILEERTSVEDIENLQVVTGTGKMIALKEVATITYGLKEADTIYRYNGKDSDYSLALAYDEVKRSTSLQ